MSSGQKRFMVMRSCHQLLSAFLANGHLPRLSCQSSLTDNDKGDNGVKQETVHRSPCIYLTVEENPRKPQLGEGMMKVVLPIIASNGIPYFQMKSAGSHSKSEREMEGMEEG